MHVLWYSWMNEKPSLLVRGGEGRTVFPLEGKFNAEILPGKWCIGYYDAKKGEATKDPFVYCDRQIVGWKNRCPECEQKDAITPCMQCRGDECKADEAMQKTCKHEKYCVYLALFGGIVKVGVSRDSRFSERLLEQGADQGLKVAFGNGMECRLLEQKIVQQGIPDSVSYQSKIISLERVHPQILEKTYGDLKERIPEITEPFKPKDFSKYYPKINASPVFVPVEPRKFDEHILGAKGQLLLFASDRVLDLKKLAARKIEVHA